MYYQHQYFTLDNLKRIVYDENGKELRLTGNSYRVLVFLCEKKSVTLTEIGFNLDFAKDYNEDHIRQYRYKINTIIGHDVMTYRNGVYILNGDVKCLEKLENERNTDLIQTNSVKSEENMTIIKIYNLNLHSLGSDLRKIIEKKFNEVKKSRLARLFVLSCAYFIILTFLIGIFFPFFDKETNFSSDYLWTILFLIPFLLTALYIILRKKQWIILPAKIVFWIILVLAGMLLIDLSDMVTTEPILVALFFLMVWPLLDLYRNNLRHWVLSLKNKPFCCFKKKSEISIKEIILMILTIIVFYFSYAYDVELIDIISFGVLVEALLIITYLLLKESPLKSIIKLIIILGCSFFLSEVLVSIINGELPLYIFFEGINNVFIRESLRYASVLAPSLYGLGIIFLYKK